MAALSRLAMTLAMSASASAAPGAGEGAAAAGGDGGSGGDAAALGALRGQLAEAQLELQHKAAYVAMVTQQVRGEQQRCSAARGCWRLYVCGYGTRRGRQAGGVRESAWRCVGPSWRSGGSQC